MDLQSLQPYFQIAPAFIGALVFSLLLVPILAQVAIKYGFIDLPASMRKRTDPTLDQRIHEVAKPRLAGVAALLPVFYILFTQVNWTSQLTAMGLGLLVITISGIWDDKNELSNKSQFLFQFLAAFIVVLGGISIKSIDIVGTSFNFVSYSHIFDILGFTYQFLFPADIITIFWILIIINAVNWVCGIDALGESLTVVAGVTITMLSVKAGNIQLALLPAVLTGGVLGFIPYNFPPSKVIGGTAAHTSYGFLLAVISIFSGAKITTAIIILSIPLVDMLWVIFYRIKIHVGEPLLKRPFISGRVHLHHRLMALGYSAKQTLFIEIAASAMISVVAFYFGGFSNTLILIAIVISALLIMFAIISVVSKRHAIRKQLQIQKQQTDSISPPSEPVDDGLTPEERFAY